MSNEHFGRYELLGVIGEGGMGRVYRALDEATDRVVALKILPEHFAGNESFRERFRREAQVTAKLSDPHVVPIHNYGEIEGRLYLDMRLIEGKDVATLIKDGGRVAPAQAVSIIHQVASALDAAHANGLVHRDVKPSNVLVTEQGFAYLIDFGIARGAVDAGLTSTGAAIGTFAYMAPERFTAGAVDARSDVYALSCMFYEMLAGATPFEGHSLEQQVAAHLTAPPPKPSVAGGEVPTQFDSVIARGMAKNPDERFTTAAQLAAAGIAALDGAVISQPETRIASATDRRPDRAVRLPSPMKEHNRGPISRRWYIGAATCLASVALVLGGMWLGSRGNPTPIADEAQPSSTRSESGAGPSARAPAAGASDNPGEQADGPEPTIDASGFGGKGTYLWVTSIVRDAQPGQFIVVSFNLLGADGAILATRSQTEQGVNANARMIIGTQVEAPKGQTVTKVEPTLAFRKYDTSPVPPFSDVVLQVGDVSIGENSLSTTTAQALITNPSDQQIPSARVGIACFDAEGNIIGGGSTFPQVLPPGGQIMASGSVMTSRAPDRCEMTAQPSG